MTTYEHDYTAEDKAIITTLRHVGFMAFMREARDGVDAAIMANQWPTSGEFGTRVTNACRGLDTDEYQRILNERYNERMRPVARDCSCSRGGSAQFCDCRLDLRTVHPDDVEGYAG